MEILLLDLTSTFALVVVLVIVAAVVPAPVAAVAAPVWLCSSGPQPALRSGTLQLRHGNRTVSRLQSYALT